MTAMNDAKSMRMQKNQRSRLFQAAKWTIATLAVVSMLAIVVSLMVGNLETLASMTASLTMARPYIIALHLSLIALLWLRWPRFIGFLEAKGKVHPSNKAVVLASRNRIALLLLAVEVFVVIGFPFAFLN